MNTAARWVPRLLTTLAVLHLGYAVADQSTWGDIIGDGLWNAVEPDPARESELWFLALAPAFFALAGLARAHARATGRLPASLGVWLIATGLLISVLVPVSGGWILLAIGAITLVAARAPRAQEPERQQAAMSHDPARDAVHHQ